MSYISWLSLVCLTLCGWTCVASESDMNGTSLITLLMSDYDKRISPSMIEMKPTVFNMGIYVLEMHSISDQNMEYSATIYFRRIWTDPRLQFSHLSNLSELVVRNDFVDNVWVPDIFFTNEREAHFHEITLPNTAFWISKEGEIFLSSRYSLTLGCPMDLQKYPLDTQYCKMEMECYSYNNDQVRFQWRSYLPMELPQKLYLQSFSLSDHILEDCANVYTSGGFPCLRAVFTLERNYGYHLITTYIPSGFIVIVSWVSFWISPDAVPGRVTLGVTTVLTIITQSFIGGLSMPQVPYVKAIDVWMATAMTFVFASLIEFAMVNVTLRHEMKMQLIRNARLAQQEAECDDSDRRSSVLFQIAAYLAEMNPVETTTTRADFIDKICRLAFPIAYSIFAVSYWIYYLNWEPPLSNF